MVRIKKRNNLPNNRIVSVVVVVLVTTAFAICLVLRLFLRQGSESLSSSSSSSSSSLLVRKPFPQLHEEGTYRSTFKSCIPPRPSRVVFHHGNKIVQKANVDNTSFRRQRTKRRTTTTTTRRRIHHYLKNVNALP